MDVGGKAANQKAANQDVLHAGRIEGAQDALGVKPVHRAGARRATSRAWRRRAAKRASWMARSKRSRGLRASEARSRSRSMPIAGAADRARRRPVRAVMAA